jgi:lysozyme
VKISARGVALIARFEGFPNGGRPYNDPVGYATVGYGHLIGYRRVTQADRSARWLPHQREAGRLTELEGRELLDKDLVSYERAVEHDVKVPITQGWFDALTSLAYNEGTGAVGSSTLMRLLNRRDYKGALAQFPRWNKAGGHVLDGLTIRRYAEMALVTQEKPQDRFAGFARDEESWIRRFDALHGHTSRRAQHERAVLVELMTARRKLIWAEAQRTGWLIRHRRVRYRSLLRRTR